MDRNTGLSGYTLLEILLVLSIIAASMVMATPCFRDGYYHIKTLAVTQQISNELYLARNLAMTQRQRVHYCTRDAAGWDNARMIINQAGQRLHVFPSLPQHYHLRLYNSLGKNTAMTYTPLGFTQEERSSFYLTAPGSLVRLTITLSGRLRIERSSSRWDERKQRLLHHQEEGSR